MLRIEKKVIIGMTAGKPIHSDECPPGFVLWLDHVLFKTEDCDYFNLDGEPVQMGSTDMVQPLDMTGGNAG